MAATTTWLVVALVGNFTQCIPIVGFWDRLGHPPKCFNNNLFMLITGIIDILVDVALVLLPVRVVLGLQMPARAKAAVLGVFVLYSRSVASSRLVMQGSRLPKRLALPPACQRPWPLTSRLSLAPS